MVRQSDENPMKTSTICAWLWHQGRLGWYRMLPLKVSAKRFSDIAGRVDVATKRNAARPIEFVALVRLGRYPGM